MRDRLATGTIGAALLLIAVVLTYPYLRYGLPEGHDRLDHLQYQHFFNDQIARGDLYPRWIQGLNQGRGSVIFLAQYPLPYYVAWGIGKLIPNHWGIYTETHSQGIAIVLATALGAFFAYLWCSTIADSLSSTMAAILFITLPYFLGIELYLRIAIGEFWALVLMPLALYFVERRASFPRSSTAGLALAFALILVSHVFTAFLLAPVLLAYAAWRSEKVERIGVLFRTAAALLLGIGIAGVYTVPLFTQHKYLHPEKMLVAYGARLWPLSQMFSYDSSLFPVDDLRWKSLTHISQALAAATICFVIVSLRPRTALSPFRILVAMISIAILSLTLFADHLGSFGSVLGAPPLPEFLVAERAEIFIASFLTLLGALLCYWSLRSRKYAGLANFLVVLALGSFLIMTRWSLFVWKIVRPIWNIQFPWRFNVFLAVATVGLAALALSEIRTRSHQTRRVGFLLYVSVWVLVAMLPAWRGSMRREYLGTQPVTYQRAQDYGLPSYAQVDNPHEALAVRASRDGNIDAVISRGEGDAQIEDVRTRQFSLHTRCETDCMVRVGQFYYPAWHARLQPALNEIAIRASNDGGLMEVSLPQGEYKIVFDFSLGWSEKGGACLSVVSLAFALFIATNHKWPSFRQATARELQKQDGVQ